MSKRSVFTTITALPPGVTRETVLETLHTHTEMIDLNPLVKDRHPIKPPPKASPEEYHCQWYEITDTVQYLPGGLLSGSVSFNACFHDLADGIQTHIYAPLGLEIRGRWTVGGSLPGEPQVPVEIGKGIPLQGLYLREDSDVKCNFLVAGIVKNNLKNSHAALVARILARAQIQDATQSNNQPTPANDDPSSISHSALGSSNYPPSNRSSHLPPLVTQQLGSRPVYSQSGNPYATNAQLAHSTTYPQPYFSSQPASTHQMHSYQADSAYPATNPHWQPQIPPAYASIGPPQELASQEAPKSGDHKDKVGVSPAGPPAHPVAVSELPGELPE